jgi:hypothetical protein
MRDAHQARKGAAVDREYDLFETYLNSFPFGGPQYLATKKRSSN